MLALAKRWETTEGWDRAIDEATPAALKRLAKRIEAEAEALEDRVADEEWEVGEPVEDMRLTWALAEYLEALAVARRGMP